ncbi:restriction endonuclease subunit S [Aerococcus urinaeequi]|uniref:restriction endonuclease subunit S n=1 Tax=Aerococcus urinaeequi TaxID=51665 RepID=UPI003D6B6AF3
MSINKNSQKAPNLRFKGFTDDWEQRKLNDEVYFFNKKRIPIESDDRKPGQYPYYGATGIIDYVDNYIFDGEYILLAEDGANIVTRNSPIAYITKGRFWVNNHAHIMKMKFGSNYFLLQLLERNNYEKFNSGTAQPKLNSQVLKNITFNFPGEEEKTRIGSFLKNLDHNITLHQRKLDQLNQLKEALLQQMFPGKGETVPKLRFAGFEGDWEERKLGEISKIKTGSSDLQDADTTGNYPFFVRSENIERSNRFLFEGEAILIPGEGRLGEIYHYINGKFDYHQRVYKISNFSDYDVQGLFVLYYLKNNFKRHALKYTVKATVDSLRLPTLLEFNIMVPNLIEQEKIGNVLNCIENTIILQQRKLDQLQNMKQVLLENMFI